MFKESGGDIDVMPGWHIEICIFGKRLARLPEQEHAYTLP
jgi:hypothetical protein